MRVVRELAMARTVSTGGLLVHAAAVRTAGGGVVVLCGPKGSGKTTLVMSLLVHAPGAAYVANDRCVVRANGSGTAATVRGLPTLVSIRSDTLERFPVVRARLDGVRPEAASRPRATVTPPEFLELVGRPARAPGGPLLALVFPRVGAGPNRLALRRLGPAEAEARLREGLFRAGRTSPLGDVFVPPGAEPAAVAGRVREEADRAVRRLAADVPCFECLLGGGAPPGAAECRALLANVGAAAG
jgi:energy-coupling factor transporter ATP-binding protein EcfA2